MYIYIYLKRIFRIMHPFNHNIHFGMASNCNEMEMMDGALERKSAPFPERKDNDNDKEMRYVVNEMVSISKLWDGIHIDTKSTWGK